MKFLAYLMAVAVLLLSFVPCDDIETVGGNIKLEDTHQTKTDNHDEADACSPFCICACCSGFSINHSSFSLTKPISFTGIHFSNFLSSCASEIHTSFWQPPRRA